MIEPRWGHRMVAHGGRLYVVGGRGGSARTLIYTAGKNWTTGPTCRARATISPLSLPVVEFGQLAAGTHGALHASTFTTRHWQAGPDLPHSTSGAAEAVVDEVIFIFGGEEPSFIDGGVNDRHWKLDTRVTAPRWEPAPAPPLAVHGTNAAVLEGMIAIAGGASRHGAFSVAGWTRVLQLFHVR